jgi:hypothetical protein
VTRDKARPAFQARFLARLERPRGRRVFRSEEQRQVADRQAFAGVVANFVEHRPGVEDRMQLLLAGKRNRHSSRAQRGGEAEKEQHVADALLAAEEHVFSRQGSALASAIALPALAPVRSREQQVAERAARKVPVGVIPHRRA